MINRKQIFSVMIVLAAVISIGFYSVSSNDNNVSVTPSGNDGIPVNSNPNLTVDNVGAWTNGAPITTQDYFGSGVGYTRNDTGWVYVIAGNAPSAASTICQRYNVNTNTWAQIAPLPTATVVNGSAQLRDSIYCIGGFAPSTASTNFVKYDINANTWTPRAPLPTASSFCKGVGYQDSLIYAGNGYNGAAVTNIMYLYNALSNTWRTCTPLPAPRFGGAFSRSGDTLIYAGGADLSLFYNTTYKGLINQTDRSIIVWTTGAICPGLGAGMYRIDAHNWGCKGIIMTGGSNSAAFTTTSNICYSYSPGTDVWSVQANKTTAWTAGQSGTVRLANGIWKLVCASGYNGAATIPGTEIFTDTLCGLVGINPIGIVAGEYSISQNYPNPFNPSTQISYNIPKDGFVKIVVSDILGREVATLVNGEIKAGLHEVNFNASALSSGIYFYRIDAGDFTSTKKMLLIK